MIDSIFIDTSFLIALCNEEDRNYKDAKQTNRKLLQELKKKKIAIFYSDYIFDELITTLKSRRVKFSSIKEFGNSILKSNVFNQIFISQKIFNLSWKLFLKYQDKEWSFTDVTSFKLIETFKIKYYLSYDKHFS
ncbi:MAG: type II toxin-antitoxin system VapC family toxin, partial [Promethearchaeota archaeon]